MAKTHLISSNSPSGGIKLIVRSESNLPSLTHWWNWQSSNSTDPSSWLAPSALLRSLHHSKHRARLISQDLQSISWATSLKHTDSREPIYHSNQTCILEYPIDKRASRSDHRYRLVEQYLIIDQVISVVIVDRQSHFRIERQANLLLTWSSSRSQSHPQRPRSYDIWRHASSKR